VSPVLITTFWAGAIALGVNVALAQAAEPSSQPPTGPKEGMAARRGIDFVCQRNADKQPRKSCCPADGDC
jgi:hypothetical protein